MTKNVLLETPPAVVPAVVPAIPLIVHLVVLLILIPILQVHHHEAAHPPGHREAQGRSVADEVIIAGAIGHDHDLQ